MGDTVDLLEEAVPLSAKHPCDTLEAIEAVSERAAATLSLPTEEELSLATQLIKGHSILMSWQVEHDNRLCPGHDRAPGNQDAL